MREADLLLLLEKGGGKSDCRNEGRGENWEAERRIEKMKTICCADLFCGGGGTSTGMIQAFQKAGINFQLIGVNHWNIAIETNKLNHPFEKLYCSTVQNVKPREAVPSGRLHFLWASPECTNHSRAKGGRPRDEQSRSTAWDILKWAQELYIDRIYIENVVEFLDWGPIDAKGRPMDSKKGETFRAFVAALESLGYRTDWQTMNAADFGAPTSRVRLIIQAVRGRAKIVWPQPTHAKNPGLFQEKPWRSAREIIDWTIPGKSIFARKKPLAENTIRRIESGIRKYWGEWAEPFLVILRGTKDSQCRASARKLDESLPTVSAGGVHAGIVEPFLVRYNGGDDRHHSINDPVPVLDCSNRFGLVNGYLVEVDGAHYILDIRFRMLQPHELAAGMGFPKNYKFAGNKSEQVRQIGNAVCPNLAEALIYSALCA